MEKSGKVQISQDILTFLNFPDFSRLVSPHLILKIWTLILTSQGGPGSPIPIIMMLRGGSKIPISILGQDREASPTYLAHS